VRGEQRREAPGELELIARARMRRLVVRQRNGFVPWRMRPVVT